MSSFYSDDSDIYNNQQSDFKSISKYIQKSTLDSKGYAKNKSEFESIQES